MPSVCRDPQYMQVSFSPRAVRPQSVQVVTSGEKAIYSFSVLRNTFMTKFASDSLDGRASPIQM
jgi:hypothetical protein